MARRDPASVLASAPSHHEAPYSGARKSSLTVARTDPLGTQTHRGFTIVELAIVIVVIAALAAISMVAYNGVIGRAHDTAVVNDLNQFVKKMMLADVEDLRPGTTGTSISAFLTTLKWKAARGSYDTSVLRNLVFCHNNVTAPTPESLLWGATPNTTGRRDWALVALSKSGTIFYLTDQISTPTKDTEGELRSGFTSETNTICGLLIGQHGIEGFSGTYHGYVSTDSPAWRAWTGGGS